MILRGAFIAGGKALLDNFHWMVYVFGGFLVLTAIRLATQSEISVDPGRNPLLRAVRRRLTPEQEAVRIQRSRQPEGEAATAAPQTPPKPAAGLGWPILVAIGAVLVAAVTLLVLLAK